MGKGISVESTEKGPTSMLNRYLDELNDHQRAAANVGAGRAAIVGAPGCLDGETTKILYKRRDRNGTRPISLKDLHDKFNGIKCRSRPWEDRTSFTYIHSVGPGGVVYFNRILGVTYSGLRPCVRITADDGSQLICTTDHPFLLKSFSYMQAASLWDKVTGGTEVLSLGSMRPRKAKVKKKRAQRSEVFTKYHPNGSGRCVRAIKRMKQPKVYMYRRVCRARLVIEADLNGLSYGEFIRILKEDKEASNNLTFLPKKVEIHHRDENSLNDVIENLQVMSKEAHAHLHGKNENFNTEYTRIRKIVDIEWVGERETYDISVEGPDHNFAANGFFVHNSGKTRAIVARIARLVRDGVDPRYILGMTFTNQAASVMNSRLGSLGVIGARVGTQHSLCNEILKAESRYASSLDLDTVGKMGWEVKSVIGRMKRDRKIGRYNSVDMPTIQKYIAEVKATGPCYVFGNPFGLNAIALEWQYDVASSYYHKARVSQSVMRQIYINLENRRGALGIYDFDDMQCLTPGQKILTSAGYRSIEEIQVGDLVLTHRGRWRRITRTFLREYTGIVHRISCRGSTEPITVTPGHPVFAAGTRIGSRKDNYPLSPDEFDWVLPESLQFGIRKGGSYLFSPAVMEEEESVSSYDLGGCLLLGRGKSGRRTSCQVTETTIRGPRGKIFSRHLPLNVEVGMVIGLYLAEGSLSGNGAGVHFYLNESEDMIVSFLIDTLARYFGVITRKQAGRGRGVYAYINSVVAWEFFSLFGKKGGKSLPWFWLKHSNEFLSGVLRGWLMGDGCLIKKRGGDHYSLQGYSISKDLIEQMRGICYRLGLSCSLSQRRGKVGPPAYPGGKEIQSSDGWSLNLNAASTYELLSTPIDMEKERWGPLHQPKRPTNSPNRITPHGCALKVHEVVTEEYTGPVYNLEVEEDESYVIEGLTVHNCWAWMHLVSDPGCLDRWRNRWSIIIVDEFQDSSAIQCDMGFILAGMGSRIPAVAQLSNPPVEQSAPHNIMVAGDPSQSIFEWRSASPKIFVSFAQAKGTALYTLPVNYRSVPAVCEVATQLVKKEPWHLVGDIIPARSSTGELEKIFTFSEHTHPMAEARAVIDRIEKVAKDSPDGFRSCMVLSRLAAVLHLMEIECIRKRIPYIKRASGFFLESREVMDILAYLRVAACMDQQQQHLERCLKRPFKYISREGLSHARRYSDGSHLGMLQGLYSFPDLPRKSRRSLMDMEDLLNEMMSLVERGDDSPGDMVRLAIERTSYVEFMREDSGAVAADSSKVAILDELAWLGSLFSTTVEFITFVDQMVASLRLNRKQYKINDKEGAPKKDCLILSTIHRAKGQEVQHVFLADVSAGRLPWNLAHSKDEELRLLFVGITRAKDTVNVSWSRQEDGPRSFLLDRLKGLFESFIKQQDKK